MTAAVRFDLGDPSFDVTSPAVHAAREESWYVETTWGWAVLRYDEASALLRDRRFRQGNARWPEQNGVPDGAFAQWCVARTDMEVALPLLARRMPDAECDGPGEWLPVSGNTGAIRFPITFTPSPTRRYACSP